MIRSFHETNMMYSDGKTCGLWSLLAAIIFSAILRSSPSRVPGQKTVRKPDLSFNESTRIKGRTITCDSTRSAEVNFTHVTWSCYDMRVDDLRVRYWYIPGFGAETACSDGKHVYDSRNDVSALCREMLNAHGYRKELSTVFVNDASCSSSARERVIFALKNGVYRWESFPSGRGYIKTLRCMVAD